MRQASNKRSQSGRDGRRQDGDLAQATWKTHIDTIRIFLHFCVGIDAVSEDLPDKLQSPKRNGDGDKRKKEATDKEHAEAVLDYRKTMEAEKKGTERSAGRFTRTP